MILKTLLVLNLASTAHGVITNDAPLIIAGSAFVAGVLLMCVIDSHRERAA